MDGKGSEQGKKEKEINFAGQQFPQMILAAVNSYHFKGSVKEQEQKANTGS